LPPIESGFTRIGPSRLLATMAPCCTDHRWVVVRSSRVPIGDEPAGLREYQDRPRGRPGRSSRRSTRPAIDQAVSEHTSPAPLPLPDYRAGSAASRLASAGVTISVAESGGHSLTTVQVRHVRRSHLYPRWAAFYGRDAEMLLVEEERDRTRRVLAASFTVRYE